MTFDPNHLPDDPAQLKDIVVALLKAQEEWIASDAARQKAFGEMVAEMAKLNVTIQKLTEMLFGKKNDKLTNLPVPEQGCWSHARDNFVDTMKSDAKAATEMIEMIAELYEVEKRAKKWTPENRLALRREESVLILDRIVAWCREKSSNYTPKDPMSTAIRYCINNWDALWLYRTDGTSRIDNNACERLLRQLAVGRKNWLFFGNAGGGKTACIPYTLPSSARRHGLNEFEYLCDILARLADLQSESEYRDMLPDRWQPRSS